MARTTIATPGFLDRLGDRVVVSDRTGGDLEVLRLRPELTADPAFERCLKERAEQLSAFQHRSATRVRGVSRLPVPDGRLAVVSDAPKGWRLSEVLQAAEQEQHLMHTSAVLFILRQVASAITALQALGPDVAHGALGPERVVLSSTGRVLVVECVLGSALDHLPPSSPDRLWKELRLAVPSEAGSEPFGPRTDVLQLGIVALSLIHNRLLRRDEYPGRLSELLDTATESRLTGARQPIGPSLRGWLEHALGLASEAAPWTMQDAQRGLDWIVSKEGGYFSTPVGLEPLLQSVNRFFTVLPASEAAAPERKTPAPSAPPATAAASPAPAGPATSAIDPQRIAASSPVCAEQRVAEEPVAEQLVEPQPLAAQQAEAGDAPGLIVAQELPAVHETRILSLVPPLDDSPREAIDTPVAHDAKAEADDEPLLVTTSSPLAEFAAERASDPFPVPVDVTPLPAPRPPLRPVPPARPASATDSGAAEVAAVADMLSVDRPPSSRRSGWNNEAWMSHSSDRQPGAGRTVVPGSGATARVSRSGSAATAVALHPRETPSPVVEPVPVPEVQARKEVPPIRLREPREESPIPSRREPREESPTPSRSLFGVPGDAGEHDAHESEASSRSGGGGKAKWLAIAAVAILCMGGFAAWSLLKPSASPTSSASSNAVAPESHAPAAQPAASAPAASSATETAAAVPAAPEAAAPAAPAMGFVQLLSPLVLNISEKGEALGTSGTALSLPAGRHVLDLANEEVGYRATQAVDVRQGRVTRIAVALPRGAINVNATPWAEVLVDGQRVGETPLGNVQLTVGSHEVRFRHPQLGEQVRTVVVTAGTPARLSVDMKQ